MNRRLFLITIVTAGCFQATARAEDTLPIKRGFYIREEFACGEASNATLTLYDGTSFGQAHVACKHPSSRKMQDGSYQITQSCKDTQGSGGPWEKIKTSYKIISSTKFIEVFPGAQYSFKYCSQSALPEPWSKNDLTSLGIK
jgi:hypothetical protein